MNNKKIIPFINAENEMESSVVELASQYALNGADELFIYNYAKDEATREEFIATLKKAGKNIDIPFIAGCYVERFEDVKKALYTGACAVVVKKEILKSQEAVLEASKRFGKNKLFLELSEEEFYDTDVKQDLEKMEIGGLVLKHVNTGDKLENALMKLDTQVIIRDSLVRNDLLTLCSYEQVKGISTNHFENKSIMKVKRSLLAEGVPVNAFESAVPFSEFKLNKDGMIPVVAQDYKTNEVLMVAYMNEEAYNKTVETGKMTYWSRSRNELWCKGDTSGHYQYVMELKLDCDKDTILAKVHQIGAACHTGNRTCFFTDLVKKEFDNVNPLMVLNEEYDIIADRKKNPKEGSYTNYLFDKGIDKILKKCGEEATEIVIAAKNPEAEELKYEISDFLYHMMVLMVECGVDWNDIMKELANRR
ncbi:bifunctional phosphoribosyl-AMP cyclohydrolase/phosphoribosyl-ATP diphosphatase HisIE [[Clostridium] polysaccharolyticum]|uniref:Histidine biosynthesis bifunctional protein HisIE n=1 Tax=[Clostridium] polysaccharolyticum TaxID=29364 RepID=A0A1I0AYT5_9FIRM|nr:bifunctional phosphoribosyl-AMP cyclohydrolase/phosphoribosyl-ATP diphosphatase HisIE [[Clostridium] polysaccharolyticum]SES98804.1 phosphoribosyl-ATP pyrophosphatase /phosphoribosyl-AMP cyclohydrolase [[Clostridium] polysaccharolyticum]